MTDKYRAEICRVVDDPGVYGPVVARTGWYENPLVAIDRGEALMLRRCLDSESYELVVMCK